MEDKTGGPAFPIAPDYEALRKYGNGPGATIGNPGMDLLDYFAGQALAMSHPDNPKNLAEWAYIVARAMIAERSKNE